MSRIVSKAQVSILTLVLMLIFPFSSYGIDGQRKLKQPVTFPIIITQSGSYVLTGNLVVTDPNLNAITISVNDVTLDLNGHFIQGPNTGTGTGCGVYAYERYSITIKNGRVRGFGDRGIFLYAGSAHQSNQGGGHRIEDIQALNNALYGIAISGGGVINNCIANSNGMTGITAAHSTVTNCIANNNWVGIFATGSTVTQCTADYNTSTGIITSNSLIKECMFIGNGKGISSEGWNYIVENNSRYNQGWGLYLEVGTQKDFVIKNVASDNGSGNFGPAAGNYMPICGVDATDNCNYGF